MYLFTKYLTFSDAAKMADVARNIVLGRGWGTLFNFFNPKLALESIRYFPANNIPPAMPYAYALFFKIFGISDSTVILTSTVFFLLSVLFIYLLGKKLYGKLAGILAALSFFVNINFLEYAKTGASETLFILEVVLIPYLLLLKKKWANITTGLFLVLMYFTRPQAFIFIASYILFWLLINYDRKKVIKYFGLTLVFGLIFDYVVLQKVNVLGHSYSLVRRGASAIIQHSQHVAVSDVLRGVGPQPRSLSVILKKLATNLFNFYRLLPQIMSPYLFALFMVGLFIKEKNKEGDSFKIITLFSTVAIFLLTGLTIPFFRYIHPVIPLIYIVAVGSLVSIVKIIAKEFRFKVYKYSVKISKQNFVYLASLLLIFVFTIGINIGILIHDYKYYEARNNFGKPPSYVLLSEILKENTSQDDFIVTNLDTWGSWYGERKTMWFPLKPDQLIPPEGADLKINAIFLTTYRMEDENYYVGDEWRDVLNNPNNLDNDFLKENYQLVETFSIEKSESYENVRVEAVLLRKISN